MGRAYRITIEPMNDEGEFNGTLRWGFHAHAEDTTDWDEWADTVGTILATTVMDYEKVFGDAVEGESE